ncbi:MAG TPA: hypothetical protein VMA98_12145 [Candidatus Acidoferrales bacterium]|nr:hypothetical protein [Candidatus Acidoferrales bacterium]
MISQEELAAIAAALTVVRSQDVSPGRSLHASLEGREESRWKLAARNPDLEIEDYRSVR